MTLHRLRLALLLAAALTLLASGAAWAHARLLRSNPEDGAVLNEPPREVYLWFDEAVAAEFSSLDVLAADGELVGPATLRGDPTDATLMIATLPELSDGPYTLAWKAWSNVDSHLTEGTLVFGVGQAFQAATRPQATLDAAPPLPEVALRALMFTALAVLTGGLLVNGAVLRPALFDPSLHPALNAARRRIWRLGLVALGLALAAGLAWLAWQAEVIGRGELGGLLATRFGGLWLARQTALIAALLGWAAARRDRAWGWAVVAAAVVVAAITYALGSHAAGLSERSTLAVAADTLHLLAAGAWAGSIVALLAGLLPFVRSQRVELGRVALIGWRRFGRLALISVGALAATGLYSAARQVASVDAWIATLYGQVLAGKVGLFLMAGLIGATNAVLLHPELAARIATVLGRPINWRPVNIRRLPSLVVAEAVLVLAVFVGSGILTATPPARGPEFDPPRPVVKPPSTRSATVDDLLVSLSIRPNKPGPNIISIEVLNTRRPAPAETLRVLIRLDNPEHGLGRQTLIAEPEEANTYRLNTSAVSLAGRWEIQVVVRRKGMEDSVAEFDWQVESLAPNVVPRPVMISNAPIEPLLSLLAAGLALGVGAAALRFWRAARARSTEENRSNIAVTFRGETRLLR